MACSTLLPDIYSNQFRETKSCYGSAGVSHGMAGWAQLGLGPHQNKTVQVKRNDVLSFLNLYFFGLAPLPCWSQHRLSCPWVLIVLPGTFGLAAMEKSGTTGTLLRVMGARILDSKNKQLLTGNGMFLFRTIAFCWTNFEWFLDLHHNDLTNPCKHALGAILGQTSICFPWKPVALRWKNGKGCLL